MCDTFCGRVNANVQLMSKHEAVSYANVRLRCDKKLDEEIHVQGMDSIEVTSEGSKLMKSVKLPTVFIRMHKGDITKSRVYHVLLQSESGKHMGEIPALMFSNPADGCRTRTAELLPLRVEYDAMNPKCASLTPMLLRARYKRMFSRGSSFKVKAMNAGKLVDQSGELPWNKWNSKQRATRMMLTEKIYQDIREIPSEMIQRVLPSKSCKTPRSRSSSISSVSSSQGSQRNLSTHYPNLKFTGVTASGGSSFAKWFSYLPPDIYVDQNFKCDHGTTLRRDRFEDPESFFKYLSK